MLYGVKVCAENVGRGEGEEVVAETWLACRMCKFRRPPPSTRLFGHMRVLEN